MYTPAHRRFQRHAQDASNYIRSLGLPSPDIEQGASLSPPVRWDWSLENARDAARVGWRALPVGVAVEAAQWGAQGIYDWYTSPLASQGPSGGTSATQVLTPPSGSTPRFRGRSQARTQSGSVPKSARNLFPQSPAVKWWELAKSSQTPARSPRSFTPPRGSPYFPSSQLSTQSRLARRFQRASTAERYYAAKALTSNWKFRGAVQRRIRLRRKNPVAVQRRVVRTIRRRLRRRQFKLIFASPRSRRRRRRKLSQTRKHLYRYGF